MAKALTKILLVGGTLVVLTWSGLRVWSARTLTNHFAALAAAEQSGQKELRGIMERMPAYKLTFLGARLLKSGDYELAKEALGLATKKDRFYRDAFRYYAYALQTTGENDKAELALRRAKTLDPRTSD